MKKYLLILLFSLISNSLWATSYDTGNVTLNIPILKVKNGDSIDYYQLNMTLETSLDNIYVFNIKDLTLLDKVKESNDIFNFADNSLNLPKVSFITNGKVIKEFHINMDLVLIFDGIITFNLNSIRDL